MMKTKPLKRRRPVTACLECYRRKQKCNRSKPCNTCLSRNIPDLCSYEDEILHPKTKTSSDSTRELAGLKLHQEFEAAEKPDVPQCGLEEQIGYSILNASNTFTGLQKSLNDPTDNSSVNTAASVSTLQACFHDRYLQLVARLPLESLCIELIEVYLNEADWYFNALDRHYLVKLFSTWSKARTDIAKGRSLQSLTRDLHYLPALLFQILACALQFLNPGSTTANALRLESSSDCDRLSETYSRLGHEVMILLGRHKPAIAAVEYDLMRTTWLKNCSRGTESWHSVGNAIRSAQELGLHLQSDIDQEAEQDLEQNLNRIWFDQYKRRIWARLFLLDSHMALILSRPRHINLDDCTVQPPTDCDIPQFPFRTFPVAPTNRQSPSSNTFLVFLVQVAVKIHEMLSSGVTKPHVRDYGKVDALDRDIHMILDGLPPAMRPQNPDTSWDQQKPHFPKLRHQIVSTSSSYLMNLHRPHIASHDRSRKAATEAALNVLESQQLLFELLPEHHYKIYGFSFYTIDAGMFLSARTIDHPPKDSKLLRRIRQVLQQAIGRLELLKAKSAVASLGERVLRQCYQQIHEISMSLAQPIHQTLPEPLFGMEDLVQNGDNLGFDSVPQFGLQSVSNLFDAGSTSMYDGSLITGSDMFAIGPAEQEYFLFNLGQSAAFNMNSQRSDGSWDGNS